MQAWLIAIIVIASLILLLLIVILWLHQAYPKFLHLPGPYKYVGASCHRSSSGIRFKLYYPSSKSLVKESNSQRPNYPINKEALTGISIFTDMPKLLFDILLTGPTKVPCYINAPIDMETNKTFPLIIFSHGIGGNWDIYSQLLCNYASYGFVVVAIEHTDTSASHTILNNGKHLYYVKPFLKNQPNKNIDDWTREEYMEFRGPHLNKRVEEFKDIYDYLLNYKNNNNKLFPNNDKHEIEFKYVITVGHSFGGITSIFATEQLLNRNNNNIICNISLDPWLEPYPDTTLSTKWNCPMLILVSPDWINRQKIHYNLTKIVYNANDNPNKYYEHAVGITHSDFSDVLFWTPDWLKTLAYGRNRPTLSITNQEFYDTLTKRCLQFMIKTSNYIELFVKDSVDISHNIFLKVD